MNLMSDEEKKVIEELKGKEISFEINWTPEQKRTFEEITGIDEFRKNCIKIDTLFKLIEKQSKVIDEMAEHLKFLCGGLEIIRDSLNIEDYSKKGITQYFYRKVENK